MIHFKKNIAYLTMDNAIHDFIFPTTLNSLEKKDIVTVDDTFDFPESTSFTNFINMRNQIIKVPLYVLDAKPAMVKKYLVYAEHFMEYLKRVEKRTNCEGQLVEKLFLFDTIIDEKEDKIIFTNYSLIALLMNLLKEEENSKYSLYAKKFIKKTNKNDIFFYKNGQKYKLTRVYNDRYIFGIGVKVS